MQAPERSDARGETVKLLALFDSEQARRQAVRVFQKDEIPFEQLHVLPQPRSHPLFTARLARWGVLGALAGAVAGGGLAWALGGLLELEHGMLVQGPLGEALTGAVIGALMVGTLGLLAGLALGEARGIKAVAQRSRSQRREGDFTAASKTLLRINVPSERENEARRLLEEMGAASVEEESHSRWWDQAA